MVGESAWQSTLARTVMALDAPTSGSVRWGAICAVACPALREARRDFQMVFQDPYGSLDPRQTVARIVSRTAALSPGPHHAGTAAQQTAGSVAQVGLRPQDLDKYPHEFSGGQRQRIAIARALITGPGSSCRRARERAGRVGPGPGAQPAAKTCSRNLA